MDKINLAQPKNKEIKIENRFDRYFDTEPELKFISKLRDELPELKLYLVGGIVRDTLVKHPLPGTEKGKIKSKDFDFVACGTEIDKLIKTLKKFGHVDLVGKNFGVLKVYPFDIEVDEPIDIALPRTEIAGGSGSYKDVETQSDPNLPVEEDLSRRDLTINAIAYDINNQEIIDPFNGQKDLEKGIIRAVGNPEERFGEDYSRMLRALRFSCRFDFEIDKKTWQALVKLMPHINDLNPETEGMTVIEFLEQELLNAKTRKDKQILQKKIKAQQKKDPDEIKIDRLVPFETIRVELFKMFSADPTKAIKTLDKSEALKEILPEIENMKGCEQPPQFHSEGDVFKHTKMMLEKLTSPEFNKQFPNANITPEFIMGVLFHDIGKPTTQTLDGDRIRFNGHDKEGTEIASHIASRLKFTTKQKEKINFMIRNHMFLMSSPDIFKISNNKVAKRFIDSPHSQDLLMLFYLDANSSVHPDGSVPMKNFNDTLEKIEQIKTIRANQPKNTNDIINGKEIIKILAIKGGALIGLIKNVIAELSDAGKINSNEDAVTFLQENKTLLLKYSEINPKDDKNLLLEEILQNIKI
jgi:putative nucleotidyltransferase with HDIG domain